MEQNRNSCDAAGADPAAVRIAGAGCFAAARISDRLAPALIEPALDAGADKRPGRTPRSDGWTPERIRTFLNALAEYGVVEDAARAAGMSRQSAYNLRNRSEAFHLGWTGAELLARRPASGDVVSRAIHGCVDLIVRNGKVWGERHRFDNRLTMAVLTRLDRRAAALDPESRAVQVVARNFDRFVELVCNGGEGADAFIAERTASEDGAAGSGSDCAGPARPREWQP